MGATIAKYYTDELGEWMQSLSTSKSELFDLERKLAEILRRNSVVGLAAMVEIHHSLLNRMAEKFEALHQEMEQQEARLKTDSTLLENIDINAETEKVQASLREKLKAASKEFIDVKFDSYNFLSETLKK